MEFVPTAPFRFDHLFVGEDGEVVAVGRFGADDGVVEDMVTDFDFIFGDKRPFWIAEQAGVNPREVAEVGEVLHLAGGVAVPRVGAGVDDFPFAVFKFGDFG